MTHRPAAPPPLYIDALKTLSGCLEKYHGKKCIILIDEYDVPLENAWFCGFYDEITGFIRSLFESALKTNTSLEFAVITGCLRISRESGEGRTDLIMKESRFRGRAVIFEIKTAKEFSEMEKKCREALQQIEDRKYEEELRREGCREILKYGICFLKKGCIVMKG